VIEDCSCSMIRIERNEVWSSSFSMANPVEVSNSSSKNVVFGESSGCYTGMFIRNDELCL